MSEFDIRLNKSQYRSNVVIKITGKNQPSGVYFSQHKVDNGLTMTASHIGLVTKAGVSAEKIDFRNAKSSIPTFSFSLLDHEGIVSALIATDETAWQAYTADLYIGFLTGSFGWGNYQHLSTTTITGFSKSPNEYSFKSQAPTALLQKRIYTTKTQVDTDLTDVATSVILVDASSFASSGTIKINDEYITYTGKSTNTLTGLTRGYLNSDSDSHDEGEDVFQVTKLEDTPMQILLDIIENQVGVDSAQIDTAAFTVLDTEFTNDYIFYVENIESALTWIEDNILIATNTRIVNNGGLISIAILDQAQSGGDLEITEDNTVGNPSYSVDSNAIINEIQIKYDYNWGKKLFSTTRVFQDTDSIANFGYKEPLILEYFGVTTSNNGFNISADRANRALERLATPRAEIGVTTFFNRHGISVSDAVTLENRFIPQPGSGGSFVSALEVLSKAPKDLIKNPIISFNLVFTSYSNLRGGLISGSPLITAVTSQSQFTVEDSTSFEIGYKVKLFNDSTGDFYADAVNTITLVNGNDIAVENAWGTTLTTAVRLSFADYDESSSSQKSRYAYVSREEPDNDFVSDGSSAYQILY